jgi:hypothetical protein
MQNINTKCQVINVSNSSANVAFDGPLPAGTALEIYNDSTLPAYFIAGSGTVAPTAVFPTSSVAQLGKVVPSKTLASYTVPAGTTFLSGIQLTSGTGDAYVSDGGA